MLKNIQTYKVDVQVEFGKLDNIMNWCKSNCTGDWYITDAPTPPVIPSINNYRFQFINEHDLISFSLKFK